MSAKDYMAELTKRTDARLKKKRKRAKSECPLKKGDIFVSTYQLRDRKAVRGIKVAVSGETKKTDRMGIAEFLDKAPGDYDWDVDWAGSKYSRDYHDQNSGQLHVAGGSVATCASGIQPAGALKVEVRHMTDRGKAGDLVDVADIVDITVNGDAVAGKNIHTFTALPAGPYTATARFRKDAFGSDNGAADEVQVRVRKTAKAIILVKPVTWLEVAVIDIDGNKPVENVQVRAEFASKKSASPKTDSTGVARHDMERDGSKFDAVSFVSSGTDIYLAEEFS